MLAPAPAIAPGVRTGQYNQQKDVLAGGFVSSADFAVAILDEIEELSHLNTVSRGKEKAGSHSTVQPSLLLF